MHTITFDNVCSYVSYNTSRSGFILSGKQKGQDYNGFVSDIGVGDFQRLRARDL